MLFNQVYVLLDRGPFRSFTHILIGLFVFFDTELHELLVYFED